VQFNTPASPPKGLCLKRLDGKILIEWNNENASDSYDLLIDDEIYSNVSSPYYYNISSIKEHKVNVRSVLNGIESEWSEEVLLNSFMLNPASLELSRNNRPLGYCLKY
jgi:hypothetical protein